MLACVILLLLDIQVQSIEKLIFSSWAMKFWYKYKSDILILIVSSLIYDSYYSCLHFCYLYLLFMLKK